MKGLRAAACLAAFSIVVSCSPLASRTATVNLPQTEVKWQSIGNCWIYATLGWVESLALRHSQRTLNLSETYLTYRHWEEQLAWYKPEEIETGGGFQEALSLIARHGLLEEGDFIPDEALEIRSSTQARALEAVNESLRAGPLSKLDDVRDFQERKALVRAELDAAFGVRMDELQSKIINPRSLVVGSSLGRGVTLAELLGNSRQRWQEAYFPTEWRSRPSDVSQPHSFSLSPSQTALLKRVKRALNAGHPVILSWFVDFNALQGEEFSIDVLKRMGAPGRQGGHMTVLEDYAVRGVDPSTGQPFEVGEGDVDDEQKRLAAEHGELVYFVIKNSWGQKLEASYYRDGSYGYHKLMPSYLFAWLPERNPETDEVSSLRSAVKSFILPPGY